MLKRSISGLIVWAIAGALVLGTHGCGPRVHDPSLHLPADAARTTGAGNFLKVHTHSNELYVLTSWVAPTDTTAPLSGVGAHLSTDRAVLGTGHHVIPVDQVAFLETNDDHMVGRFGFSTLMVWTVLSGASTAACVGDPKSCFGSCPTFYVDEDADRPVAEGFSASFARVLESSDLDALRTTAAPGEPVSILMRNEAFESHAVRGVRLFGVPVEPGHEALATPTGEFFVSEDIRPALNCEAGDGPCTELVQAVDDREFAPRTDSLDLARRSVVEFTLPASAGRAGLVVSARQSFVSTFVFYQALAFAGSKAGDYMAALESGDPFLRDRATGMIDRLGVIVVERLDARGDWVHVGEFGEPGPIATDLQVIPLGDSEAETGPSRIRFKMAQGSWRIDFVGVASLSDPVQPIPLPLTRVTREGGEVPAALAALTDPNDYLMTERGEDYRLHFQAPETTVALFLESTGYYYEWMRPEWLAEEDPAMVALSLVAPEEVLRRLAPRFKALEPGMEKMFWASRYRR